MDGIVEYLKGSSLRYVPRYDVGTATSMVYRLI